MHQVHDFKYQVSQSYKTVEKIFYAFNLNLEKHHLTLSV